MNQKGQGITEYGIVFLLGVSLCILIWFSFGLSESPLKIDSLVAVRTQNVLNSKPGESNYDLTTEVDQAPSRGSHAYDTSLIYKTAGGVSYEILYRYEGRKKVNGVWSSDGKGYKVYTFKVSSNGTKATYGGSLGLMNYDYNGTSSDSNYLGKLTNAIYVKGSDSAGDYTATYFYIGDEIYQVRNYGNIDTVMTNYSGNPEDTVTVYVKGTEQKTQMSIAALAKAENAIIDTYLEKYKSLG